MIVVIAYACALIIGITLGLIGAGGSILTIPVLVYLLNIPAQEATSYSLFIVGISAIIAGFNYARMQMVSYKMFVVFGIPSVIAILFSRHFLLPAIPTQLFQLNDFVFTKNAALMVLLALLMIGAAYSMLKPSNQSAEPNKQISSYDYFKMIIQAVFIGLTVGLVGAGGGFLIIPALVFFAQLPIKRAVGTSLFIIAFNSGIAFLGDLNSFNFNWNLLFSFSALTIVGAFVGAYLSKQVSGEKLKPAFGWFILVMGVYIILKESVFH